jgi:serine/threonine protein kinase
MRLPQPTDYNEAIQNPQHCFSDAELRRGTVVLTPLGLPLAHSGNFADVYQIHSPDGGPSWAVKCFTRKIDGLQQRYQAVSEHLHHANLRFMVDFRYLEEGIRVHGQCYPVLKMRWVEGLTLNEFVRAQLDRPVTLGELARMWAKLARQLRRAQLAHGDLQHGNVLLVASDRADRLSLRLIDYDGLWVPALADSPSGEVGHPNYQHPQRLREGIYNPAVDSFPHLVIYTALRALAAAGKPLWERYDNGDNLLFREQDFAEPAASALFRELCSSGDEVVRILAGRLMLGCRAPLENAPLLEQLTDGREVHPLTAEQRQGVDRLLGLEGRHDRVPPEPAPWWAAADAAVPVASPVGGHEALAAAELLADAPPASPDPPTPLLEAVPEPPAEEAIPTRPGAMRKKRSFRLPAAGRTREQYEDAANGDMARGRFAIADGAANTVHAGRWAKMLVDGFVNSAAPQFEAWSEWLPPLQLVWAAEAAADPVSVPPELGEEALSTFLGLVVYRKRWLDRRRWEALAVGDSCLFQTREGLLTRAFPVERAGAFAAEFPRIGSRTSFDRVLRKHTLKAEGDWNAGDRFWLMTRPLARWFLRQVELWNRPWELLERLLHTPNAEEVFAAWVEDLRGLGELEDGDLTLLAICL